MSFAALSNDDLLDFVDIFRETPQMSLAEIAFAEWRSAGSAFKPVCRDRL